MNATNSDIDPLALRVGSFMAERGLALPGEAIVVGVSGGADSTALLAVLRELSAAGGDYRLTVAHLDHAIREESADDARWVGRLARQWSLPFITECVDVRAEADRRGTGIEVTARNVRYDFLLRSARQAGAAVVAVGHHSDDNVETVLHRIVRGTHLRGLAGISAKRSLAPGVTLIRPMLDCRRAEIEDYCTRTSLDSRTDPSNDDTRYTRNFIRHELLPLLREKLNPRADQAVARLAAAAADAEQLIASTANDLLDRAIGRRDDSSVELDADTLAGAPGIVATAAVRLLLEQFNVPLRQIGADRLDQIVALSTAGVTAAVALPGGFEARRRGSVVILSGPDRPAGDCSPPLEASDSVELPCPGSIVTPWGVQITCEQMPLDRQAFSRHCAQLKAAGGRSQDEPIVEFLDADSISLPLTCRPRAAGDSFHPLGSPGRQSVGDFLTNLRLSPAQRRRVLCLSDAGGVVYLSPLRIAQRVRVTPATSSVIKITLTMTEP